MRQLILLLALSLCGSCFVQALAGPDHEAGALHKSPGKAQPVTAKKAEGKKTDAKKTEGKKYVCPMCADVVSTTPGKCPKCGMELKEAVSKPDKDGSSHK